MNLHKTTPIVKQIEDLVATTPGWSPPDQLFALFNLAFLTEVDGDIIELGSWCGRSATVLGLSAMLAGKSKVHCVDLFPKGSDWRKNADGTYSFSVEIDGQHYGAYENPTVWAEPFERDIAPIYEKYNGVLDVFLETMVKNGLNDVVIPFKGTLDMFSQQTPSSFKCKLAFVDGDHSYDAVCKDIANIERFLVTGGWICFDDAFSSYDGVNRAITDKIINNSNYERCQQMTRKLFVARRR